MVHRSALPLPFIAALMTITGCQAMQNAGSAVGNAALAVPRILAGGVANGSTDQRDVAQIIPMDNQEAQERHWAQHWRDHPHDIPAMHRAFNSDY